LAKKGYNKANNVIFLNKFYMSGHSKWNSIKRQKGAADQKRSKIFTKLGKAITVAAREGGGDQEMNFKLRLAVTKAKANNMPKDTIEKAIIRGTGESSDTIYEEAIYEGFGPDKIGVIIEVLTDNKNRAVSEIKHVLSKNGGALAANGAVMWQFDHRGVILSEDKNMSEALENAILESGALDYELSENGIEITTAPENLDKVRKTIESIMSIMSAELAYIPKETKKPSNPEVWEKFISTLEDLDDVNNFYTAADYDD